MGYIFGNLIYLIFPSCRFYLCGLSICVYCFVSTQLSVSCIALARCNNTHARYSEILSVRWVEVLFCFHKLVNWRSMLLSSQHLCAVKSDLAGCMSALIFPLQLYTAGGCSEALSKE